MPLVVMSSIFKLKDHSNQSYLKIKLNHLVLRAKQDENPKNKYNINRYNPIRD